VAAPHGVHHRCMFQILQWAAMALAGLEVSLALRTLVGPRMRRAG
jgi:hypothetical protein